MKDMTSKPKTSTTEPSFNIEKNVNLITIAEKLKTIRAKYNLSPADLALHLGASLLSVVRWERGDNTPSLQTIRKIDLLYNDAQNEHSTKNLHTDLTFRSKGILRKKNKALPLFNQDIAPLENTTLPNIITRLFDGEYWQDGRNKLAYMLSKHLEAAETISVPATGGISAGKNTYTYDAHTYHTKVPPQGIAEVLKRYLPSGGVVLDPFGGSGMTGVAARSLGYDVIINELSPAASFISNRFMAKVDPTKFAETIERIRHEVAPIAQKLYTTTCRECAKATEIQYTVWSYIVGCTNCNTHFPLWDHCRKYGRTVREHKILSEFECPCCKVNLKKSQLPRYDVVPVLVGYKCCAKTIKEHSPNEEDLSLIRELESSELPLQGFYPQNSLPDGVNLNQPKRHGLTSIDKFYTHRNLIMMSHIWQAIHRVEDIELSASAAFVFTSLYQRVTRLSDYRFWGGSGNTARFNVPHIFNEANVLATFLRKAQSIQDHLDSTAPKYEGQTIVHTGSATSMNFLPDECVDLIFTDPPFGANINYSEMNFLWESWLGTFTDVTDEAIVNKYQKKDNVAYGDLMQQSLSECYRVLRDGHWLVLVFMNSSEKIWSQLQRAIANAGFHIEQVDIFDKQHGTSKQFVSENTTGCDLMLHCRKIKGKTFTQATSDKIAVSVEEFLSERVGAFPMLPFLHVERADDIDYRQLYSEWLAVSILQRSDTMDFAKFRDIVKSYLG
ncbi:DNA (cytosine-5-)-methyltransferase [Pseudochrobactrum algeriensis]|uniref:DNA methyltransferase n=1 Tax=Pseudochrobactrum algeriensis TaxID=2834768 RepID=UPI001BCBFC27|nr:DNA methyltransferase [Pseudochrobactrum algeriensis]QVQ36531.1 DNA (cytosine-5-)-methyltransferase [Pseudochrobactrum algeriensis]QVQ39751.1 DNA (cytosine-5-)-methyltransferase [Pseudochrobactrum algeriensis]QVQ43671.1 DNA (cytosine-5-)-methyltransferase [Pseudochrobactrum algeriensis]